MFVVYCNEQEGYRAVRVPEGESADAIVPPGSRLVDTAGSEAEARGKIAADKDRNQPDTR
jgi:hypothetical protein